MATTDSALLDDGSMQSHRSEYSFDCQLMRCGFLPSNSVSSFDVRDLQDLDLNDKDACESPKEEERQDMSSECGSSECETSPMNVRKGKLSNARSAVVRRLQHYTISDSESGALSAMRRSLHGASERPVRRVSRIVPQRSSSARVLSGAAAAASIMRRNISFGSTGSS